MRRLTAWIGGIAGGVVAYRFWRRHQQVAPEPYPEPAPAEPDDRAEELRAKLAESREGDDAAAPTVEEPPVEPVAETAVEQPPEESVEQPPEESPEERRERVHEEGRAALDDMKPE
jgi:hypothetical protein